MSQKIFLALPTTPLPWAGIILGSVAAYCVVNYFLDPYGLRKYPGPFWAKITPLWMMYWVRRHQLFMAVHRLHQEKGTFVRLQPDHVSIADPDAIEDIYGHGNGFLKSYFYDAFVNIDRGIFTTRERAEHTRMRKIVSHTFSAKSVSDFEPYITRAISELMGQLDVLWSTGRAGASTTLNITNDGKGPEGKREIAFDIAPWLGFLAFDIISDLSFGEPFGFIRAGKDTNDGIRILHERGEFSAAVGAMPWIKPYTPYFYFDRFFTNGLEAVKDVARIAIKAVDKRRGVQSPRKDLLYHLLNARDPESGGMISDKEINAGALTFLIAGSDTTSNTLTHIIDMMCRHPSALRQLQAELDAKFPTPTSSENVATYDDVKNLPYLHGVIHETLRFRTPVSFGLPREVPKGGATVAGQFFKEGTVLSCPTFTIHHSEKAYENPDAYLPERWIGENKADMEQYFLAFSYGPRACIGRNVATVWDVF